MNINSYIVEASRGLKYLLSGCALMVLAACGGGFGSSSDTTEPATSAIAANSSGIVASEADISITPGSTEAAVTDGRVFIPESEDEVSAVTASEASLIPSAIAAPNAATQTATAAGPQKRTFIHPGVGWSEDDWSYFKTNVVLEPWKSSYSILLKDWHSKLDYVSHVVENLDTDEKISGWQHDMTAIHYLTVVGYVSGDQAYLEKATKMAGDWCGTHKAGMPFLNVSSYVTRFLGSADFLRVNHIGWTATQTKRCQAYVNAVYWPALAIGDGLSGAGSVMKSANQGTAQLHTAMDVAVFTDDSEKFDMVVDAYLTNTNSGIRNSLPTGQLGDSGRDQGHPLGQLVGLANVAETAWKQGVDLYAADDNRLLKAQEYWAQFNLSDGKDPPPFTEFGPSYGLYQSHGCCAMVPYPEPATIVHKAYVVRKGMSAPWTERLLAKYPQTLTSAVFYRTADSSKATPPAAPWSEPVSTPLTKAGDLIASDMGRVNGAGSTETGDGTWTLKTTGEKIESGYRFAYREMSSDSTFVARILSIKGTADIANSGGAAGGIQIRTQLNASSNAYMSLTTSERGDYLSAFWRQTTGSLMGSGQIYRFSPAIPHFLPYWMKIVRRGNFVNAYSSPDGKSWSNIGHGRFDVEVPDTIYVGLTAISGSSAAETTVTFDNVSFGASGKNSLVAAPSTLTASPQTEGVQLNWSAVDAAIFYKVQRSTAVDGPATVVAQKVSGTSFLDSSAQPNTTYYYQVSSGSFGGLSPYCSKVLVKTAQ